MTNVILGPGKYQTKGGNIAVVVDTTDDMAIGWVGPAPRIWYRTHGIADSQPSSETDITGPYVEPPKLREVWIHFEANNDLGSASTVPIDGWTHMVEAAK